ncbi:hypothetical protein C2G38_2047632 [Gigaspora rosea]|uniref:Uncharacterized protein n=1 Tax=Gigaspora rosea TaxID=44941 RepID=A0A397U594_9GLOM|nr:hypothetical protein C2G38_2047632 [Gigaspora rosea]
MSITYAELLDDIINFDPSSIAPVTLPYSTSDDLPTRIQSTYACMKQAMRLKNQIQVLGFGYYLGMLYTAATPEQLISTQHLASVYQPDTLDITDLANMQDKSDQKY